LKVLAQVLPKKRPGLAGARKNCYRYHCSWHWSISSLQYRYNDHRRQIHPACIKWALFNL